jgi:chromosome partitioning protein
MQELASRRRKKRMPLREVAERGGFSNESHVARIERSQANPTLRTVQRYAEAIGVQLKVEVEKMRVLTLFNFAGGCSKSSSSRDLGYSLSEMGFKVLLIDTDPQASLSKWLGLEDVDLEETIFTAVTQEDEPLPHPRHAYGMDIIPACLELAQAEPMLVSEFMGTMRLRDAVRNLDGYDFVLIDSPPSLGQLSALAVLASDYVIVPLLTNSKATDGLPVVLKMIKRFQKAVPNLKVALFLLTQLERTRHDRVSLEWMTSELGKLSAVSTPLVRRPAVYKDAQEARMPVPKLLGKGDEAVEEINRVTSELLSSLGVSVHV